LQLDSSTDGDPMESFRYCKGFCVGICSQLIAL
jgi:hypothetical protein